MPASEDKPAAAVVFNGPLVHQHFVAYVFCIRFCWVPNVAFRYCMLCDLDLGLPFALMTRISKHGLLPDCARLAVTLQRAEMFAQQRSRADLRRLCVDTPEVMNLF